MSFPIPPEFERAVLDRVRSGQYASADEAVEEGLRRLKTELMEEAAPESAPGRLWAQIQALRGSEDIPAEQAEEVMRRGRNDDVWGRAPMNPGGNRLHISIAPEMQQFIAKLIRAGLMGSPSGALVAAINRLDDEVRSEEEIEALRRELQIGIDELERGEGIDGEEAFARMRKWDMPDREKEGPSNSDLDALRREIDLGIESAEREPLIPGDEVVARIRAKLRGAGL